MDRYLNTHKAFWKRDSHDWWQNYCSMVNEAVEYGVHYNDIPSVGDAGRSSGRPGSGRFGSARLGSGRIGSGRVSSGYMSSGRIGSGRAGSGRMSSGMSSGRSSRQGSYRGSGVNMGVLALGYGIKLI